MTALASTPEEDLYALMNSCQSRYRQRLQDQTYIQSLSAWMFACANSGEHSKPQLSDYQPFSKGRQARADSVVLSLLAEYWDLVPGWTREMLSASGIDLTRSHWDGLSRSSHRILACPQCLCVDLHGEHGEIAVQMMVINPDLDEFPEVAKLYPLGGSDSLAELPGEILSRMSLNGEIVSYGQL